MNTHVTINAPARNTDGAQIVVTTTHTCSRCKRSGLLDGDMDPRGEDAPYPIGYKVGFYGGPMCHRCCESEEGEHAETRREVDRIKRGGSWCHYCRSGARNSGTITEVHSVRGVSVTAHCIYCKGEGT